MSRNRLSEIKNEIERINRIKVTSQIFYELDDDLVLLKCLDKELSALFPDTTYTLISSGCMVELRSSVSKVNSFLTNLGTYF